MPITITSDEKGNIHIPREFGIKPRERLLIDKMDDTILIKKVKHEVKNVKEIGDEIVGILKENLKDVKWEDIEKGREDREREW
ncbi:MAG: hypothetical protein AABX33_05020 [Nanoarchaeota archaeon]